MRACPYSPVARGTGSRAIRVPTKELVKSHRIADCGVLTVAIVLSRFLFRSRYLYDVDSVNFALALDHFDPAVHQPHPPGYFLYVCLGRLVRSIIPDANDALVAISVLA